MSENVETIKGQGINTPLSIPEIEDPKLNNGGGGPPPQVRQRGTWKNQKSPERVISDTRQILHEQGKVKITIPSTEKDKEDVTVGVNGHPYQIQRDKLVEVPLAVVEVLQNAVTTTYVQKKRDNGEGMHLVPQKVLRIPFQRS